MLILSPTEKALAETPLSDIFFCLLTFHPVFSDLKWLDFIKSNTFVRYYQNPVLNA